jgi:Flp pilus assembly protein TadG
VGREDGVVLVLVALSMTVLLGCMALAIDLTSFYGDQRKAQAAADAAALAGAQDLPGSANQATIDAQSYVARNFPGAQAAVTTSYGGDASRIKVGVTYIAPTFFAQIWGLTSERVSASAVAGANPAATHAAIFADSSGCAGPGATLNGNSPSITGGVYSNGSFTDNANGSGSIGPTTYGGPNGCSASGSGKVQPSSLSQSSTLMPYPIDYRNQPNPCSGASTYGPDNIPVNYGTTFAWTTTGSAIDAGIYCATQEIDLTAAAQLTGTGVTFIAPVIKFSANNSTLSAPPGYPLLFWVTGPGQEFDLAGEHETLAGNVFDPTGPVVVAPNNSTDGWNGFLEANSVDVEGNSFTINGTGPSIGVSGFGLTQ